MTTTDAGARVHHRRPTHHRLAVVAIGAGVVLGGLIAATPAGASPPLRDWVPQPAPQTRELTAAEIAERLPVSMGHERDALLGNDPLAGVDSATRSYIARGRAAQAEAASRPEAAYDPHVYVYTGDAKDHPLYGEPSWTGDVKDHPGFNGGAVKQQQPRPSTRAVWLS